MKYESNQDEVIALEPRITPEVVAAYLDGRLSPEERILVTAYLSESAADREVVAGALETLRELQATEPGTDIRSARRISRKVTIWISGLAAATLAGILVGRSLIRSSPEVDDMLSFGLALAEASPGGASMNLVFGAEWDERDWSDARGSQDVIPEEAATFRIGALLTALDMAVSIADSVGSRLIAAQLAARLRRVTGGGDMATTLAALANEGSDGFSRGYTSARRELLALLNEGPWFRLGIWAELSRLAARKREQRWFNEDARAFLQATRDGLAQQRRATAVVGVVDRMLMTWPDSLLNADGSLLSELFRHAGR